MAGRTTIDNMADLAEIFATALANQASNAVPIPDMQTVRSPAYEASRIFKVGAGTLYSLDIYNSKAAAQWMQIFDSATLPADGQVPLFTINAATVASISRDFGVIGFRFVNGLVVCNSTTGPTKTIGTTDTFFTARFV